MEKHIVIAVLIILTAFMIPPAAGMDLSPVTGSYLVDDLNVDAGLSIADNSPIGVNVLGGGGVGSTFLVNVENQKVGVDLYNMTNSFRIESESIIFVYQDDSVAVSIQGRTVDFGDGPLQVEDVYNLSEEQEEIYKPNKDMKNETVVNSTELNRVILDSK